jgi:hypothetical protein
VIPCAFAYSDETSTSAEAPSLVCEELPAVTEPDTWKAGASFPRASRDVSRRGPSSVSNGTSRDSGTPPVGDAPTLRTVTGTISPANRPASMAAIARSCERSANASCASRETCEARA